MERKWHIEAWIQNKCVVCNKAMDDGLFAHSSCWYSLTADDHAHAYAEIRAQAKRPPIGVLGLLARTLQWLHDAPPSEINAMTVKRREQMRELGREIAAVINPNKGSK